jgi:hypothetical protein
MQRAVKHTDTPGSAHGIIGRWEFRLFAPRLALPSRATAVSPQSPSVDIYLPTGRSDRSLKLRAGALEVKHRTAVSAEGLERWLPTGRHEFPLDAAGLATLRNECAGAWRDALRPPLDIAALVAACDTHGFGAGIPLLKRRRRLVVVGCRGEHVRLVTPAGRMESLAFEDERPELVLAAVRACALDPADNTSYPALLAPWWHAASAISVAVPLSR